MTPASATKRNSRIERFYQLTLTLPRYSRGAGQGEGTVESTVRPTAGTVDDGEYGQYTSSGLHGLGMKHNLELNNHDYGRYELSRY